MTLAFAASVVGVAGCGSVEDAGRYMPVASVGPSMTVSPTVDQTRAELVAVLGQHSLQLADTQTPVRLAESPLLTTAPRARSQVVLPKDPDKGYIVVYEFSDPSRAAAAAAEQQAYLGRRPRQPVPGAPISVIRQVGSTVVMYQWLPAAVQEHVRPDPGCARDARDRFPVAN